jgi:adenylate kinase
MGSDKETTMTLNFDLPPAIEQNLRSQAAMQGESLDTYVRQMVIDRYAEVETPTGFVPARSPEEFMARLQEVVDMHPTVKTFVDDSRESIYAGRGE